MYKPKLLHGDCLESMRCICENTIDFIVTDPPYGLHFMGKDWDGRVPAIEIWAEALRVCKPGAMLAAFGGSRTHHHLMLAIEGAGWEIRDVVMWIYGSGFPKSHNKFGIDGYGTALKPAYEPIIIAMKPLNGTFAHNAEKWGVAGINIDGCRIPGQWVRSSTSRDDIRGGNYINESTKRIECEPQESNSLGRWPANIIFDEEAAEQLDQMTGVLKSGSGDKHSKNKHENIYKDGLKPISGLREYKSDSGGASRFFYCAKASTSERNKGLEGMPLKDPVYGNDSGDGLGRGISNTRQDIKRQNTHPTVKPISLMKYIITLLAPPGNPVCLDPFMGSGSTGIACKELGIDFMGIEKEADYIEIAEKRIMACLTT